MGILTIDLSALRWNYNFLQEKIGPACTLAAVVKADAYGLGVEPVARVLKACGVQDFFVATLAEGQELRAALGPDSRIFVLSGFDVREGAAYTKNALTPVLNHLGEIEAYRALAGERGAALPAALHLDTGMNRLGLTAVDLGHLVQDPGMLAGIEPCLVMSHFACADEAGHDMTTRQFAQFQIWAQSFPDVPKSIANSSGVFRAKDYHLDMVRCGMALYGLNPTPETVNPMRPVVGLEIPILQTKTAHKGETCGYGATHHFEMNTPLAIVSMGYADGFLRSLSGRGQVFWKGFACPVHGRVSMDLTIVDLSGVPENIRPVVGDRLEILGPHQSADDLARAAGTLGYEILTGLSHRYKRLYTSC